MNIIPSFIRHYIEHRPNLLKIVDNIGWLFFDKILRMGVGLFVGVWIARYLGPEQFGLLNFTTAFIELFGAIATLGLQSIVVRDIVHNPSGKEETLGTAAILQFLGGLIAYTLILTTIFWLRADDALAKAIASILGSMMLFKAAKVSVYWFESQVLSKYTVWVQNGVFLLFAVIKVGLILQNSPLIAFAWAIMAEALVVALLMLLMLDLRGPQLSSLTASFKRTKTLLADSWPLLLSGIAIMIYMKIDQIMLGQMIGDEAVGIYSAATRVSEVWYFVPMAIVASVFPAILETKKRSEKQYYERLQCLYDLMVWIAIAVALPMTFLSTTIISLLFGDAYEQAGSVLAIHVWAAVFVSLGLASGKWFLAENRQILSLQRTVMGAIVNVGLNFLFIPLHGVLGAAVATVVGQATACLFYDAIQRDTRKMFVMKIRSFNLHAIWERTTTRL
ncbi:membrane protein involved in the export of O-antigen and teichoic acid [Desulfocapsa sulfexigens DSM 10523]|uniref:Membrane protein involved in the export of O-antigen and teichoic acid n=1 Tax=Desulfocapsa sulfexigens (strain DSM 10523 / SB164P1) TaxID=1167006 RepID=M1PQY3_DESSD|nr:flippase [Desulfocapsa sulfexigens]AGF78806.1 membrane protein involved in the export of O-antigen and teichoic acid [Desulfocapsa sulfexigens DSM 10523]